MPSRVRPTWELCVVLLVCLLLASCGAEQSGTSRTRAAVSTQAAARDIANVNPPIHAVAHLKAISRRGEVFVDRGPVTGTFDMTMTLTIDDATGLGTFEATAADGFLKGTLHISTGSMRERNGEQVFAFAGSGEINGGNGRYRAQRTRDLKITGEIRAGGVFNMTLRSFPARAP